MKTVAAMMRIYCRDMHKTDKDLCPACAGLFDYANRRLNTCPFQEGKTTCANCRVHCYKPDMREKIRKVMRFAGPRMTLRHPILALFHMLDAVRKEPTRHSRVKI